MRRGLVASRTEAQAAIRDGLVTVDGGPAFKAATQVHAGQSIAVAGPPRRYVSRGGDKLVHGLDRFGVEVQGRRCLDAGASTGGFTDCLLQRGAAHVTAIDVGYGQIHERIRTDERVTVRERTNIRDVSPDDLEAPVDLIVADLSFISLRLVLPVLRSLGWPDAEVVALVKPQFEADREAVGKGGVVRDPEVWRRVLRDVAAAAAALGWQDFGVTASPLLGPAGNVEFLVRLRTAGEPSEPASAIDEAVTEGLRRRADQER